MAWNRRSRAPVDDPAPETAGRDGVTATGRVTPAAGGNVATDARDRTAVEPDPMSGADAATDQDRRISTGAPTVTDRTGTDQAERDRMAERDALADRQGTADPDAPVVAPPVTERGTRPVVAARPVRARGSLLTTIGLIVSVVGLCGVLTGLLAPEGLIVGLVGAVLSLGGLAAARREGVTGSGAATFGIVVGVAAAVLAILAMTGKFSWPNSRTNQVQVWHDWLVAHWSTLRRW